MAFDFCLSGKLLKIYLKEYLWYFLDHFLGCLKHIFQQRFTFNLLIFVIINYICNSFSDGNGGDVTQEGHAALFATLIARTAKDIDFLIESLPSEECSPELQAASLHKLEAESSVAGRKLEEAVKRGEKLLEFIQQALTEIAESRLRTK